MRISRSIVWGGGVVAVVAALFVLSRVLQERDPTLLAAGPVHWHPRVEIYVDGEKIAIPAGIGLAGRHEPIHTHTEDAAQGVVHLEFPRAIREDDVRLKQFFAVWDKDIMSAFGTLERMEVNGAPSGAFGEYVMRDGDLIRLYYTTAVQSEPSTAPTGD
ncbi:MAG: hypothetical protein KatS3mg100_379 [Candidatus Parcubacteria bacterium]|nr:MAG: hypothetical protein KatS3mg100_379 [Candidatus Parcubacteria bacterium]